MCPHDSAITQSLCKGMVSGSTTPLPLSSATTHDMKQDLQFWEIGVRRLNNKEGNLRIPRFSTYRFTDLCMHLKFHALSHPSLPFVFH